MVLDGEPLSKIFTVGLSYWRISKETYYGLPTRRVKGRMRLGRCGSRVWACALACAVLLEVAQGFAPAPVLPPRPARAVSAVRMQADTTRPAAASGQQDDGAKGDS